MNPLDVPIRLVRFRAVTATNGAPQEATLRQLFDAWEKPAVIPADRVEREKAGKVKKPKDAPGYVLADLRDGRRAKANVITAAGLAFDFDAKDGGASPQQIVGALGGLACVVHTTTNHTADVGAARAVIALSRPATKDEHPVLWEHVRDRLVAAGLIPDPSTRNPDRFWFDPLVPEGAPYERLLQEGAALDVDASLKAAAPPVPQLPAPEPRTRGTKSNAYGRAALDNLAREVRTAPEGARNATLNERAFRAAQLVAGGELDEAEATEALRAAAVEAGLEAEEIAKTLASGFDAGKREPRERKETPTVWESSDTTHLTELGNSERLVAKDGARLRHCKKLGGWYTWTGTHWKQDTTGRVFGLAKRIVKALWLEGARCDDDDARKAIFAHAKASEKAAAIAAMVRLAESAEGIAVDPDAFDSNPWLFNCTTGTVDLKTGRSRPHDPREMITKIAPVAFDAAARCPRWEAFLEEVLPDPEVRAFVQRFAGYCMTGVIRERVLVLLIGEGRNGKSVFVRVLTTVLGAYAAYAAPDVLMSRDGSRHPTELADLCGVRLAAMSEVKAGSKFDEETLKRLTGNEPIKARFMNQDFFQFEMRAKLAMAANHRPRVADTTESIWDRLREVPFTVRIDETKEDKALVEKLCGELPGILNWCLQGCAEWQKHGLGSAAAIRDATSAYRAGEDPVAQFFADRVVFERGAVVTRKELRSAYDSWANEMGERKPLGVQQFTELVRRAGALEAKTGGIRHWVGARLWDQKDDAPEGDPSAPGADESTEESGVRALGSEEPSRSAYESFAIQTYNKPLPQSAPLPQTANGADGGDPPELFSQWVGGVLS